MLEMQPACPYNAFMSLTSIVFAASIGVGLGALAWVVRYRRRSSAPYVLVAGEYLIRARLSRSSSGAAKPMPLIDRWRRLLQRREATRYIQAPWRNEVSMPRVNLERRSVQRVIRIGHGYEVNLASGARNYFFFKAQVSLVAAAALLGAVALGRNASREMPRTGYDAGEPNGVSIIPQAKGRWYLSSLSTPTPHPFATYSPPSAQPTTNAQQVSHTNTGGGGHTNSLAFHTNVPQIGHTNLPTHTNAITSHSNTDARPYLGPY